MDGLSHDFAKLNPDAFARVLGRGESGEIAAVLNDLSNRSAATIASRLPAVRIADLLAGGNVDAHAWLENATLEDAVKLAGRLPREHCLALVNSLENRDRRQALRQFLNYPAHTVGAVVSDVLVRIPADTPVTDVLGELRNLDDEHPSPVVLTTADGSYAGVLNTWALVVAEKPTGRAKDYAINVPPLPPEMPLADAALNENWRNHGWLPVVDHKQRVVGAASRNRVLEHQSARDPLRRDQSLPLGLLRGMAQVFASLLQGLLVRRKSS